MKNDIEPSTEELKSLWNFYDELLKQKEFALVADLIKKLIEKENVSSMRMVLNALKGWDEVEESRVLLRNKIESIIGKIY